MRTLFASLCIALLLCAPASAQVAGTTGPRAQVAAPPQVLQAQPNAIISGSSLLNNSWRIGVLIDGRLIMQTGPNFTLTGTLNANSIGDFPCTGTYREAEFVLMCQMDRTPVIFAGIATYAPPVATQRRRAGAGVATSLNRSTLSGKVYLGQMGITNVTPGDFLVTPLTGTPWS